MCIPYNNNDELYCIRLCDTTRTKPPVVDWQRHQFAETVSSIFSLTAVKLFETIENDNKQKNTKVNILQAVKHNHYINMY